MTRSSWLWQALVALLFLIPAWLTINSFNKNFNVRSEVVLIWYMVGVIIGTLAWLLLRATTIQTIIPKFSLVGGIILSGIIFGAVANSFLFRSISSAPNPGLPIAISGTASVFVFAASLVLGKFLPRYFPTVSFNAYHLAGIVCTVVGVFLVSIKK